MNNCFHCGDTCETNHISIQEKKICCLGCKTVFEILNENNLTQYYQIERAPGNAPSRFEGKFDFLENGTIASKLLDFDAQGTQVVSLLIPSIHYSLT